jgi:hypothetical protein
MSDYRLIADHDLVGDLSVGNEEGSTDWLCAGG